MTSSVHLDNEKKYVLILGKRPTQRIEHTRTSEKMHSINFTENKKKFSLSLHHNGANNYLLWYRTFFVLSIFTAFFLFCSKYFVLDCLRKHIFGQK